MNTFKPSPWWRESHPDLSADAPVFRETALASSMSDRNLESLLNILNEIAGQRAWGTLLWGPEIEKALPTAREESIWAEAAYAHRPRFQQVSEITPLFEEAVSEYVARGGDLPEYVDRPASCGNFPLSPAVWRHYPGSAVVCQCGVFVRWSPDEDSDEEPQIP